MIIDFEHGKPNTTAVENVKFIGAPDGDAEKNTTLSYLVINLLAEYGKMTKIEAELFLMEALRAHVRYALRKAINNAKGWRELWQAIKFVWAIRQTRKKIVEELND